MFIEQRGRGRAKKRPPLEEAAALIAAHIAETTEITWHEAQSIACDTVFYAVDQARKMEPRKAPPFRGWEIE